MSWQLKSMIAKLQMPFRRIGSITTIGICFKQHFDSRYSVFYNPSPPRMFLSLDLLSEYRIQHGAIGPLYVTSNYSTLQLCNWLSLRCLVSWINHLPRACWSTFWKSIFKHQLGCRFHILGSISSFFCILTYAIEYVLIHQIIFWLYLYFLNILYFFKYSCTKIFHKRSLCTFYHKLFHVNRWKMVLITAELWHSALC